MCSEFSEEETRFITWLKNNMVYGQEQELNIPDEIYSGVVKDEETLGSFPSDYWRREKLILWWWVFCNDTDRCLFVYFPGLFGLWADIIAASYKIRLRMELLFKQVKQSFLLRYFMGEYENITKTQAIHY